MKSYSVATCPHLCTHLGLVRVRLLGVNAFIVLDVPEGAVHEPAAAAKVTVLVRAVNKVLFGKAHQLFSGEEMLSLQRTSL